MARILALVRKKAPPPGGGWRRRGQAAPAEERGSRRPYIGNISIVVGSFDILSITVANAQNEQDAESVDTRA